ncbi:MAG: hypothetical protein COT91_04685 [Candidatus Doudnabacteria bacterium CG10_big_fil_rev_8_21_14_0_10_41_10]|uniref:Prepilin-type N-terminal cleavage/methylation domain-containing protein n=1 Tax=Candidatus Doudnabacteria bacterium CG10_big_fil_rev_8_21_14_0_10_41_10 TaxID=1974551 RepID=A0A2H0VEW5_9BACT|nr:MAG: hypothetical protein COT91_04685 [Candidatus Doudnabacteria bacterium CG10_big_fil_rev_8_21_14_0_10_41_10]
MIKMKNGFTLIETVIVIGVFVLVIGVILSFVFYFYKTERFALGAAVAIDETRKGLDTAVKEIRQARESEAGNFTLEQADDYELVFYSNIDGDNRVERVHYFLDGTDFKKGVVEPSGVPVNYSGAETVKTLAQYVVSSTTPIFTYYNGDWPVDTVNNPLSTPANLTETKMILIKFQVDLNPISAPELYELEAFSQIRNLKENL